MAQRIGIIDSGVGGLSCLVEAEKSWPDAHYIYLGDNLRCPYGPKSDDEIVEYSRQMVEELVRRQVDKIIIACNTATAIALPILEREFDIPLIGVIRSGAQAAIKASVNKKIAVIGTTATIRSQSYTKALKALDPHVEVHSLATQEFVDWVEAHEISGSALEAKVAEKLHALTEFSCDTLILGCTHFPLLRGPIQKAVGENVFLIDAGLETVHLVMPEHERIFGEYIDQDTEFLTTGDKENFRSVAEWWLGRPISSIQSIVLGGEKDE